jgi:lipopolysaccharide biosynthesis glycosyltransferase
MSLRVKYRNTTEFSNYRFLIPEICNYQGKAIWLDSDMICLSDIGELFDTSMNGCDFLAKRNAYKDQGWGLSVMLIDCEKCRFDLEFFFDEIEQSLYTYTDLHQMRPAFLSCHPYTIGELDSHWNVFDYHDENTQLIHYTNLLTQPWKYPNHPYGELWFQYFNEARALGYITPRDIELSRVRSYVRRNLLEGNAPSPPQQGQSNFVKRGMRFVKRMSHQYGLVK